MPQQSHGRPGVKRLISNFEPTLQHSGVIFTFIVLYILANITVFFITAPPAWRQTDGELTAYRLASAFARGAGATLDLNAAIIIIVASRYLMTYLRQTALNLFVPFDKAMPAFHSLVGNFLCAGTFVHMAAHIVRYSTKDHVWGGLFGAISLAISGGILTLILCSMRLTSLIQVRRKSFEVFFYVHHCCFVVFFILIIMHGSHKGSLKTWMYVIVPLCIYIIDRVIRLKREHGAQAHVGPSSINIKSPDIVCLRLPRLFDYRAGQYCDVRVSAISSLQWHPFTIASSPHENEMRFYIKVNGDWTRALHTLFQQQTKDDTISVDLRGPFGAPAEHVGQYEHVVLISGGVGATPMASIAKHAHYWIMNYTDRGAKASTSVSAAFTRNQSVQGTPSIPGTPTHNVSSMHRSRNASRPISRNQSTNFTRTISRDHSRNISHTASRTGSRPISRSGSGKLERYNSARIAAAAVGAPIMRSASGQAERFNSPGRPLSGRMSRSESGRIVRYNSGNSTFDRAGSNRTQDSVSAIVHDQRLNQPYGPGSNGINNYDVTPGSTRPSSSTPSYDLSQLHQQQQPNSYTGLLPNIGGDAVVPEGLRSPARSVDDAVIRNAMPPVDSDHALSEAELDEEDNEFTRPEDYDEELGNPSLPIPERRTHNVISESPSQSGNRRLLDAGIEIDTQFDPDEQQVEEEVTSLRRDDVLDNPLHFHDMDEDLENPDMDEDGIELENEILRDHNTTSNVYNLLGMSFGPNAMMRHMDALDANKLRSSVVRTSANLMNDAIEAATWSDRILFYLHTVTVNWVMLWLMMVRFTLVFIGFPFLQFSFSQKGLGVFESTGLNIADFVMAALITVPILGAIVMEIYVSNITKFLSENIANSFDLFVLLPFLFVCIALHILNFVNIGEKTPHISKLIVLIIWPVLSFFIVWRIIRTIGSRVLLAPSYRSSHALTRSLDYIWVGKTHEDDSWLIEELLPLAESKIVRLHRFITRQAATVENWTLDYERVPLKTTYKRPDWDEVFGSLVERSRSGTVIGVFFCGQDSMARMIQQAALKAMAKSLENAKVRGYFTKTKQAGANNNINTSQSNMAAVGSYNANGLGGAPPPGVSLDELRNNHHPNNLGGAPGSRNVASMRPNGESVRSLDGPRSNMGRVGSVNAPPPEEDSSAYGCAVGFAIRVENFT